MSKGRSKKSLTEQLAELSTPRPASFHPDEDELADITSAKLTDFTYEDERGDSAVSDKRSHNHVRFSSQLEDDPRYAGKRVSRRELEDQFEVSSDDEFDSEEERLLSEGESDDIIGESDQSDSQEDTGSHDLEEGGSGEEERDEATAAGRGGDVSAVSLAGLQEDLEKGRAAKQQIALWDGLLEARIRLQKVVLLCNRLPQQDSLGAFKAAGGETLEEPLRESQAKLRKLFDNLLELQQMMLSRNKELKFLVEGESGSHGDTEIDEEIPSDLDEVESDDVSGDDTKNSNGLEADVMVNKRRRRKRKHREWMTAGGQRDYEPYVSKVHKGFRSYQDTTLTKWNNKTKLASGKISSKAFIQVDRDVLSQIDHVLKDRERLLKRTRLKRSVYHILGKSEGGDGGEAGEGVELTRGEGDQSEKSRDAHLKDYDSEIFDDDDFYHQLLRELIERKMNYTVTSDPVAMGRQWLELQKLRNKAKKKVDTKASKGRKIRYDVHPKLANFMAPIERGHFSDISRNDLFSSLFGGHYRHGNSTGGETRETVHR